MTGWWLTYPSEKHESQLGLLFPVYGKIKFVFQTTNQDIYGDIILLVKSWEYSRYSHTMDIIGI